MARRSYPQPKVRAFVSPAGTRWWRAEWHVRRKGKKPLHRVETWPAREFSKSDAQEELDKIVRRETAGARPDGRTLLKDYWEHTYWPIKQAHLARNSRMQYESAWRCHLKPLYDLRLQDIQKHDIERIVVGMATAGLAATTCESVLSTICGVLGEAQEEGFIQRNPARRIEVPRTAKPKRQTRSLTPDEAQALLASCDVLERVFWGLLATTGMRISEVYGLRDTDLLADRRLMVERQSQPGGITPTKNRKSRTVTISARLWAELQGIAKRGGYLFPSSTGGPQTRHSTASRELLAEAKRRSGIADLSYRMLRTTFATLYGGDVADVQATLGHHSEQFTVENYRRSIEERRRASVEELDKAIQPKLRRVK